MPPYDCSFTNRGSSGADGVNGTIPSEPANDGQDGIIGIVMLESYNPASASFEYPYSFLLMLLNEAELDYLNDSREVCIKKLLWLEGLLGNIGSIAAEAADSSQDIQYNASIDSYSQALLSRVRLLLIQLSQGLDYYGHYPTFVPLTSVKIYENTIDSMLELAKDVEDAYFNFYADEQDNTRQRKALYNAISSLELKNDQLKLQGEQLKKEISQTRIEVMDLLKDLLVLENQVKSASKEFKEAVSREAACGFEDVISAAGAVVAIYSGVGSIATGIGALGQMSSEIEQQKLKDTFKDKAKYNITQFKVIGAGIGEISKGYSSVSETLKRERDGAKLAIAKDDFEAVVAKFEHLEEAREYGRLMRQFLLVAQTRNGKILEIETKITRLLEIVTESEQLVIELDSTRGRLLDFFNPLISENVIFFKRAINRIRAEILRAIVMEHKALEYWSLRSSLLPKNIQNRTLAELKSYQILFKSKLVDILEERNSAPHLIEPQPLVFNRSSKPEVFRQFEETGSFIFEIAPSDASYLYYSRALVNEADIEIKFGKVLKGWSWIFLRHHGDPTLVDIMGKPHYFSHRGRDSSCQLDSGETKCSMKLGGEEDSPNGKYAFLSPIATWSFKMKFINELNEYFTDKAEKKARKNVSQVSIQFRGIADTRYGQKAL